MSESEKSEIVKDADRVYIMEENMRFNVEKMWNYSGEIICLDLRDRDNLSEKEIRQTIERKVIFQVYNQ